MRRRPSPALVAEPLVHNMRSAFSLDSSSAAAAAAPRPSTKKKKEGLSKPSKPAAGAAAAATIGILSFEAANAMTRAVNLHRSLSAAEVSRLHSQTLAANAVRLLVSPHEPFLLALVLAEKLDDLNRIAAVAARIGRRCGHPALLGFEHVYADLLAGRVAPASPALGLFLSRDTETSAMIHKMERLAASTAALYAELEVLSELEQSAKKFCSTTANSETHRTLEQKIRCQRHDIRRLRGTSLWDQTYDKVVLLLARSVCAIYTRISLVFGDPLFVLDCLFPHQSCRLSDQSQELYSPIVHSGCLPMDSGPIQSDATEGKSGQIPRMQVQVERFMNCRREGPRLHCGANPGRLFMECLSLSTTNIVDEPIHNESYVSQTRTGALVPFSSEQGETKSGKIGRRSWFGPNSRLTALAQLATVGGCGLALHYANIIIIIEKLLRYPHLIGEEARDELYQMLPSSLRAHLRKSLKSYVKSTAIYDAFLAHDWREKLEKTLVWLAPMAHDMIRWQTERNFEQQQIISRGNVLLLQTLYFADREKTEAVICELLVGLNYICRYEQQQNALLDCSSSLDFEDCVGWQMQ